MFPYFLALGLALAQDSPCPPDISPEACAAIEAMILEDQAEEEAARRAAIQEEGIRVAPLDPDSAFEALRDGAGSGFDLPGPLGISPADFNSIDDGAFPTVEVSPPVEVPAPAPPPPVDPPASALPTGPSVESPPPPPLP